MGDAILYSYFFLVQFVSLELPRYAGAKTRVPIITTIEDVIVKQSKQYSPSHASIGIGLNYT